MARQKRSTSFAQESTRPITQVALYARVSTLNNQDPEMQLSELREYAGRRGWQIVEEFTDQGVSGCKESRPALNRLMSDACRRRFDAILVWKKARGDPREWSGARPPAASTSGHGDDAAVADPRYGAR
jgi:predicted site-specific integrase-resolvase